jgi:hypothetical protein
MKLRYHGLVMVEIKYVNELPQIFFSKIELISSFLGRIVGRPLPGSSSLKGWIVESSFLSSDGPSSLPKTALMVKIKNPKS